MASIRKRKDGYTVEIRRKGFPHQREFFPTQLAAKRWAIKTEAAMDNGTWIDVQQQGTVYISDVLLRWQNYIHPNIKIFCESKLHSVAFLRREFAGVTLDQFTNELIMSYAKTRRQTVSKSTLNTELSYLAQCVDFAKTIFKIPLLANPVREIRSTLSQLNMIGASVHLDRRLREGEYERLMAVPLTPWLKPVIDIAMFSAMRQGEIHALTWDDVDFKNNTIFIKDRKHPTKKIGNDQIIPMFPPVREAFLRAQNYTGVGRKVLHVKESNSISDAFARVRKHAGIYDLRFHDLRHEAISLLFGKKWTIPQVAAVSGHNDWSQLKRYTQLKPGDLLDLY